MNGFSEAGWSGYGDAANSGYMGIPGHTMGGMGDTMQGYEDNLYSDSAHTTHGGFAYVDSAKAPSGLNIRSEPSTNGAILATMPAGAQFAYLEDMGNGWARVEFYGTQGFASTAYITLTQNRLGGGSMVMPPYPTPDPAPSPVPPQPDPPQPAPAKKSNTALIVAAVALAIGVGAYALS